MNPNKLHIGSGNVYLPGWTNVDIFSNIKADVYSDVLSLPFEREEFDIIYACHVLEHLNRNLTLSALTHWRNLLKTGGLLRIAVPDFNAICKHYTSYRNLEDLKGLMYGGQKFILDTHRTIFDAMALKMYLKQVGFKSENISFWNWDETEHTDYDDYSQAYLPHMDKKEGMLMSLNMEVIK